MLDVRTYKLKNGCTVLVRPTPDKQILSMVASVRWGGRDDAPEEAGRANMMARLLTKGTRTRNAFQIAETMESVGGSINAFCSYDALGVETLTVESDWRLAFDVMTECLFEPTFPQDEFDKEKAMVQAEILREEDEKFAFAYKNFQKILYQGHPYEHEPEGEVATVGNLTRDMLTSLHGGVIHPNRMLLVVVGNLPDEQLLAEIEKRWPTALAGSEQEAGLFRREVSASPQAAAIEPVRLTKDIEQAFLIVGYPGPLIGTPESSALRVACGALGEGMSARLFARLRDRDHLAYAVGSSLITRELASHLMLYIGTSPTYAEKALEGMLREAKGLMTEVPDEKEIDRAKRYIIGKYLLSRQTNLSLANSMSAYELMGLGWEYGEHLPERVHSVTPKAALEAVQKYVTQPTIVTLEPNR